MVPELSGRIHSIETFGALDGPGIRYVIFLQGCPLKCLYCHNPDSWCRTGGETITAEKTMKEIKKYRHFIASGGVTLSGGEPLMQPDFCAEILRRCRTEGIHTAIDTSGVIPLSVSRECVDLASMVILDIKAIDPKMCKAITGADNKNAFALLDYCEKIQKPVWIRHVLLPGYTLNSSELVKLADYLKKFKTVTRIELLPFHKMGEYKWKELNRDYRLFDVEEPGYEEVFAAKEIFIKAGLPAK